MKKSRIVVIISLLLFIGLQAILITMNAVGLNSKISMIFEDALITNTDFVKSSLSGYGSGAEIKFREIEDYGFSNILLVSDDGYIKYSKYNCKETSIYSLWNVDRNRFLAKGGYIGKTIIDGEQFIIISEDIAFSNESDIKKIVTYVPVSIPKDFIGSEIINFIIISLIQFVLGGVLIGAILYYYIKKSDQFDHIKQNNEGYYIFSINRNGIIISKSDNFNIKFEIKAINDYVVETPYSLAKALSNCLPINLLLDDKNHSPIFLKCVLGRILKGYKIIAIDDTENYLKRNKLNKSVYIDSLTNLENEKALEVDLDNVLQDAENYNMAMTMFELRNLENIAILFGKECASEITLKCVDLFKQRFEEDDIYFTNRKEFVLFTKSKGEITIKEKLNEFINLINSPISLGENLIQVHCLACYLTFSNREKDITLNELIQYSYYSIGLMEEGSKDVITSRTFTKSKYNLSIGAKKMLAKTIIEQGDIELFFQPQVNLATKKTVSFESLVRLKKEDVIDMSTQEFIMISELNGYMIPLGDLIFDKAFSFAKEIEGSGIETGVNISPIQLMQVGFVDTFLKKYRQYDLKPKSISIEITETFLMRNIDENIGKLRLLQENGIEIHLDDFGKGYSSLTYLKRLPINAIKIDREFVEDITENKYSKAISKIVIETCKDLDLFSIAEGIETEEQSRFLAAMGCTVGQGYLYGKAMPREKAKQLIKDEVKNDNIGNG